MEILFFVFTYWIIYHLGKLYGKKEAYERQYKCRECNKKPWI